MLIEDSPNILIGYIVVGVDDLIPQTDNSFGIGQRKRGVYTNYPTNCFANNLQVSFYSSL
jgi:hypothetical protein